MCLSMALVKKGSDNEPDDNAENQCQGNENDLRHAHLPEKQPQGDYLGVLNEDDYNGDENRCCYNDFRFHDSVFPDPPPKGEGKEGGFVHNRSRGDERFLRTHSCDKYLFHNRHRAFFLG